MCVPFLAENLVVCGARKEKKFLRHHREHALSKQNLLPDGNVLTVRGK